MRNPWKNKYQMLKMDENARHMAQTGDAAQVVEILKTLTPRQRLKILKIEGLTDDLIKAGYEPFDLRMRGIPEAGMLMKKARERQECVSCRIFRGHTINLMNLTSALDRMILTLAKKYPQLPIKELAEMEPLLAKRLSLKITKKRMSRIAPPSPGQ
ncbi:MAG: hypothetical protein WBK91_05225 [Alphaproteobacteria bacterium]